MKGHAKQQYVAGMFTRIAGRYDLMNTLMTGGMHHYWKRKTARLTAQGLGGKALDVATGTGDLALALARLPEIEHAVGVDLLPEMLVLAREKTRASGKAATTTWMLGDALSLPFPDDCFACATAGFSLRNMPDLAQALAEMARVVRPGGRVTTLELTPFTGGVIAGLFRFYFHRVVPLLGQLVGDRSATAPPEGGTTHVPTPVGGPLPRGRAISRDVPEGGTGRSRLCTSGVWRRGTALGFQAPRVK